jgi:hypothetical protein
LKNILIALALTLAAAAPAAAYSHSFTNRAPVTVRFWANYAGCSNDSWAAVKPGETITWRSGLCCISEVKVQGNRGTETGYWRETIPGYKGWPAMNWPLALVCRNTNWSYDSSKSADNRTLTPGDFSITGP